MQIYSHTRKYKYPLDVSMLIEKRLQFLNYYSCRYGNMYSEAENNIEQHKIVK